MSNPSLPHSSDRNTRSASYPFVGHVRTLYGLGLHVIPGWGGGRLLRGTDLRVLADEPPDEAAMLAGDYADGMVLVGGTTHPAGGFITLSDVDRGPRDWPTWPLGTLYAERGTADAKAHIAIRTADRWDGQLDLRTASGELAVELKGRGRALRCWPTRPVGKPRGYSPLYYANPPTGPPSLTVRQLAEGLADYLSRVLGETVTIDGRHRRGGGPPREHRAGPVSASLTQAVESELERRGARLRPPGRDGWRQGRCPLHDDRVPSFSINFARGVWKCWAGCGSGGLWGLARRLDLPVAWRDRRGHLHLPRIEVQL